MTDKSLDFGCTDAPMSDAELKTAADVGGAVVHVPMTLGAVAPIYNLPDLKEHIRFSGPVLAGIFLGRIHRWNDPELTALNPGLPLPDHEIAVVHRLDSSGTTYVWTDYLSKVSPEWQSKLGVGKDRSVAGRPRGTGKRRSRGSGQAESMEHWIRATRLRYP